MLLLSHLQCMFQVLLVTSFKGHRTEKSRQNEAAFFISKKLICLRPFTVKMIDFAHPVTLQLLPSPIY